MTLAQAQSELALVNSAIANVLAGGVASYSISSNGAGRSTLKLSLADLREQRRELEAIVARMQNGTFTVAQFRCPE